MTITFPCHFCGAPMPSVRLRADATGLMLQTCEECLPDKFAEGTQPGKESLRTLQNRTEAQQELQVATARAEAALCALYVLVAFFKKEMRNGYTDHEQQQALRTAERLLRDWGKK